MTIQSDLDAWWITKQDYDQSNEAKAKFQETMSNIDEGLDRLQTMYAAGDYDKLPLTVKNKFVWAWQQLNNARTAIKADADFMAALNWRPGS